MSELKPKQLFITSKQAIAIMEASGYIVSDCLQEFTPVKKELLERIDIALFNAGVVAEIEGLDDAEEITNLRNALSEYDV